MTKARLAVALCTLTAVVAGWAVPLSGAAHRRFYDEASAENSTERQSEIRVSPDLIIKLSSTHDRGFLIDSWIAGRGPFVFAIDTGAGTSIISRRVSRVAHLAVEKSRKPLVGGLSTSPILSNEQTTIRQLSIGLPGTVLTAVLNAAVVDSLPSGIDGILDPADVSPFGYAIDLPNRTLEIFGDEHRLSAGDINREGALVRWVRGDASKRPFVRLGDGRLAVIDTGSSFGLAVSDGVVAGRNHGRNPKSTHDLGGGAIQSTRVAPTTVSIGSLVLRGVPTDLLSGVSPGTPVIIGRDALYPFRISFDSVSRLIAIEPSTAR